jgi:uncharacterized membrane protein YgcG
MRCTANFLTETPAIRDNASELSEVNFFLGRNELNDFILLTVNKVNCTYMMEVTYANFSTKNIQ